MVIKDLKKMLAKENPSGEDLGRLMIADLVATYKNARDGKQNAGLLDQNDRANLTSRLRDSAARKVYNDYVCIHEVVRVYGGICQAMAVSVEMQFWRVYCVVTTLIKAEEIYACSGNAPVVMTQKEYEERRDELSFCRAGVAVLQPFPPCSEEKVDQRGWYRRDDACTRFLRSNMAESILAEQGKNMTSVLESLRIAAKAYYCHAVGLELIGKTINVPITDPLIYPFPKDKLDLLNDLMGAAQTIAERFEIDDPEQRSRYENDLRKRVEDVFCPIDLDALKPSAQTVEALLKKLTPARLRNMKLAEELSR